MNLKKLTNKYDPFMQKLFKENYDLFDCVVWGWLFDGWELTMDPTPEQIAACLLMEAKTQNDYVQEGTTVPEHPVRLRQLARQIIDHYHGHELLRAAKRIIRRLDNGDSIEPGWWEAEELRQAIEQAEASTH